MWKFLDVDVYELVLIIDHIKIAIALPVNGDTAVISIESVILYE